MNFKYNRTPKANQLMRLEIKDFKGVDYSNTPLNVAPFRATEMQNFIYDKGINQSRNGWTEVFRDYLKGKINGFWSININGETHYIVHVGNLIRRVFFDENSFETTYKDVTPYDAFGAPLPKNQKSFGIVKGDRLYIFCGAFVVYNGISCSLVNSEKNNNVYIPTTTISISPIGADIDMRTSHEKINMLTRRRKNKLIGESEIKATTTLEITDLRALDDGSGNLSYPQKVDTKDMVYENIKSLYISFIKEGDMIEGVIPITRDGSLNYYDMPRLKSEQIFYNAESELDIDHFLNGINITIKYDLNNKLKVLIVFGRKSENVLISCELRENKQITYQLDTKNIAIPAYNDFLRKITNEVYVTINNQEYIEDTMNDNSSIFQIDYEKGQITFFDYYPPEIEGESNIIVEFAIEETPKTIENYKKINECRFGIMFGYNDAENLFISGNPNYPNMDWRSDFKDESESDDAIPANEDLTYFPDTNYTTFGDKESKIMGYSLLNDGSLAIHKSRNGNNPTLYIRNAIITDAIDAIGNIVYDQNGQPYKEVSYPIRASMTGEAVISEYAFANLAGDNLMLGENGVYSVVISNNVNDELRYARERSRLINDRLMRLPNIENAAAIVYKNKYYLSVNNECYIADARFKSQYESEMSDTFSYEWWRWTNIPAIIWFTINDKLAFGTEDGQICIFDDFSYVDRTYIEIGWGGILFDEEINKFTISQNYNKDIENLKENDTLKLSIGEDDVGLKFLLEEQIRYADIINVDNGTITVTDECFNNVVRYLEGKEVMMSRYFGDCVLTIENLDYNNNSFDLYKDGVMFDLSSAYYENVSICTLAFNIDYKVINVDYVDNTFQVANLDGELRRLYWLENSASSLLVSYFSMVDNVETYWQTPIFNLGTAEYSKNMHSINLVPEVIEGGKINFGFKTRDLDREFNVEGVTIFDFSNIDFSNFTFETSKFAKSFTKKIKVKNFNFITFFFKSNNGKNCAVNSISITYNINKLNKGVK